jgi:hypothetical protein
VTFAMVWSSAPGTSSWRTARARRAYSILCGLLLLFNHACGASSGSAEGAVESRVRLLAEEAGRLGRPAQQAMLSDGRVTDAEYRQSKLNAIECMERQGIVVGEIVHQPTLEGYQLVFVADPGTLAPGRVGDVAD